MALYNIDERMFPGLTVQGREMLQKLSGHPHAPILRNVSGHRLTAANQIRARNFEKEVAVSSPEWNQSTYPDWMQPWLRQTWSSVPAYRSRGTVPEDFTSIQTISRADLSRDITRFVPDTISLEGLIQFSTSGTTGCPLIVPSHPLVASGYLAFHRKALARLGITLTAGQGDVSVVLVGFQRRCFTYVSVNPLMNEAGLVKLNLNPDEWRSPDDRATYLDALAPELISGDPLSLSELARLPVRHSPRALLSTSMALSAALRSELETRFACPVLDIYSMNECGPVACYDDEIGGHLLLQHHLYIEILTPEGENVPPGTQGEITLTGGFNPYLPLLRYRTGDFASLSFCQKGPFLRNLQGRAPVRFRSATGVWFNNIDVTHALSSLALSQYTLNQKKDGSLTLHLRANDMPLASKAVSLLLALLGEQLYIDVRQLCVDDKVVQYSSEIFYPGDIYENPVLIRGSAEP